jgi:hypothetical protein
MATDHDALVPVTFTHLLINPELARFLGAGPDSRAVVQIGQQRVRVVGAYYDDHTDQIVLYLADQGEGGDR